MILNPSRASHLLAFSDLTIFQTGTLFGTSMDLRLSASVLRAISAACLATGDGAAR